MNKRQEKILRHIVESEVFNVLNSNKLNEDDADDFQKELGDAMEDIFPTLSTAVKSANKDIEANITNDKAIISALNKNPKLKKLATESKMLGENKQRLNEDGVVVPIIGLALGLPKIIEWTGIAIEKLGKKFGHGEKFGKNLAKIAHAWHDVYINIIKSAVKSFFTGSQTTLNAVGVAFGKEEKSIKKLTDKQVTIIAKVIYIAILLSLGGMSTMGTVKALASGDVSMSAFEALVTIVKGADLVEIIPITIGIALETT